MHIHTLRLKRVIIIVLANGKPAWIHGYNRVSLAFFKYNASISYTYMHSLIVYSLYKVIRDSVHRLSGK